VRQVPVEAVPLELLTPAIGSERAQAFADAAGETAAVLRGRAVVNVNSTAAGGGVAEMLAGLLPYARGIDVDVRWLVVDAPPEFFVVTKRVHNLVHGNPGDGQGLGAAERDCYEHTLAGQADELLATVRRGDVVILHDPQTLGLAPAVRQAGARVIWRCHIGADRADEHTHAAWQFLSAYFDDVDAFVVSHAGFAPPETDPRKVVVIPPSIDPLQVKNQPLEPDLVDRLLVHAGLVAGEPVAPPVFTRPDGSPVRVDRRADVVQLGPPAPDDVPLVVQVSRWDRLKDMAGVLRAFSSTVDSDAHLLLVGPNVRGVADDPEGAEVLDECTRLWRRLPHAQRERVHLVCLPTADVDENAVLVNAVQRRATVVVQKSLAEGFGLTVTEAMWKGRPVVASAVGGIRDQIVDGISGVLVGDATDLTGFGRAVQQLLDDPARAAAIGKAGHERALDFMPDLHLMRWAELLVSSGRAS
jgi:trehalose synthase